MRPKLFFINGGAGRVICSIPAFEKYQEENPDEDFLIICEGGTDFFKGHPTLYGKVYDNWHKNLFRDKLIHTDVKSPEPYRVWEYYNQKCNLSQAFDIEINGKGIRELPKPTINLTQEETINGKFIVEEVRLKTGKRKTVVFQPFGRGVQTAGNMIGDNSKQIGVVAQELEEIFPSMIDNAKNSDSEDETLYKSVKYSVFVPMLIKSIQELTAKVEMLENRCQCKN